MIPLSKKGKEKYKKFVDEQAMIGIVSMLA